MNFGFRYHLASLMAVFFSLVLGILVGGALFQDSALVEEQGLLIADMEIRFHDVQANLALLQSELGLAERAWNELRNYVVRDKLVSQTVVLVDAGQGSGRGEIERLETVLQLAGADLQRIGLRELAEYESEGDPVFAFWLDSNQPPPLPPAELQHLAEGGANLVFVWGSQKQKPLNDLPASLQIDGIDTPLGEIALILGISFGCTGHYGVQEGSEGFFPWPP